MTVVLTEYTCIRQWTILL